MLRVFVMLGQIKEYMEQGQPDLAEAQVVQWMKEIHQFALDGSWKVSTSRTPWSAQKPALPSRSSR
eukprot:8535354-Heterocapsa_arctica.AAC.1